MDKTSSFSKKYSYLTVKSVDEASKAQYSQCLICTIIEPLSHYEKMNDITDEFIKKHETMIEKSIYNEIPDYYTLDHDHTLKYDVIRRREESKLDIKRNNGQRIKNSKNNSPNHFQKHRYQQSNTSKIQKLMNNNQDRAKI